MQPKPSTDKDFLTQALDNAMVGFWHIQINEKKIYANETCASILGYKPEEIYPVTTDSILESCHQHDRFFIEQFILQTPSSANALSFSRPCQLRHKNRQWIDVHLNGRISEFDENGNPVQITGTLFDISGLDKSKQSLDYRYRIEKLVSGISRDFVETKFEKLDETIYNTLKKIGLFCEIDRSYLFLFHWDSQRIDNTHEWCAPGIQPEKDHLQNLPCSLFPWWMKQLYGKKCIYFNDIGRMPSEAIVEKETLEAQNIKSIVVVPVQNKEKLIGFMGFDSVIEKKVWHRSDIELLETVGNTIGHALVAKHNNDLLIREKEKAEESNRLKSAFLATMNHELRTPLHHILGFSELIKNRDVSDDQTELYASKIYDSGRNLLQIVEDILALAIGNQSDVKVRMEPVLGINLYLQQTAHMKEILAAANREKDIQLKFVPKEDFLAGLFLADKNKINQILINLFKNAVKFTPQGIIEYGISIEKNQLTLYMKDEGVGISEEQRDAIFDFFRQGDDSMTRRFNGVGIGLSLCRNLVHILNGEINLRSEKGKGTTFEVKVPIESISDSSSNEELAYFPIPDYSKYRFLIVDDDHNSSFLLKNMLAATRARVLTTGSDVDALTYMGEACFLDVILININANLDTSLALIREMNRRCNRCSIIGLTSHSLLSAKDEAINAGCFNVISRPIEPQLLYEAINRALTKKNKACE
ncbi:ATP-binding protein [Mangrovibacterium sp.]|uniref:hybrid sensor histidine kinase/response regulator n=1 Tax=Mangrovibacterium sp. TaxID=1961364 RepID=UPI003566A759